jgi:flagellar biogenesis protein FliO
VAGRNQNNRRSLMLMDLFGTFSGLLSLGIIVFIIAMAVYLAWLFMKLSAEKPEDNKH